MAIIKTIHLAGEMVTTLTTDTEDFVDAVFVMYHEGFDEGVAFNLEETTAVISFLNDVKYDTDKASGKGVDW